jgi:hypothetical protein
MKTKEYAICEHCDKPITDEALLHLSSDAEKLSLDEDWEKNSKGGAKPWISAVTVCKAGAVYHVDCMAVAIGHICHQGSDPNQKPPLFRSNWPY